MCQYHLLDNASNFGRNESCFLIFFVYTRVKGVNMFIELEIEESHQPVHINIRNISSVNGAVVKMNNCDIITVTPDSLKKLLSIVSPKEKSVKSNEPKTELLELFEQLHKLTGGKGKPVFSLGREKKLKELLTKHRMTKELLIKAATNIGKDDFLQGRDPNNERSKRYGDIDYLLRPDKAAKWSEDQADKKKKMF